MCLFSFIQAAYSVADLEVSEETLVLLELPISPYSLLI
jgi:hypothetical protein